MRGHIVGSAFEVIDSDGHIIDQPYLWSGAYMTPAYRDRGPSVSMTDGRLYYADGSAYPVKRSWVNTGMLGFERAADAVPRYGDGRRGAPGPHGRVEDLDLEGI